MISLRREAPPTRAPFFLSEPQVQRLIALELDLRNQIFLELFTFCGLHLCEAATLEIARLEFDKKQITVVAPGYGGYKTLRLVPLPDGLAAKLKKWIGRRAHGYVFPGRDRAHITPRAIQDVVRAAGARIGIPGQGLPGVKYLSPMLLRHTCARRLQAMGMDYEAITKILGLVNLARVVTMYPTSQSYEEVKGRFLGSFAA